MTISLIPQCFWSSYVIQMLLLLLASFSDQGVAVHEAAECAARAMMTQLNSGVKLVLPSHMKVNIVNFNFFPLYLKCGIVVEIISTLLLWYQLLPCLNLISCFFNTKLPFSLCDGFRCQSLVNEAKWCPFNGGHG